MNSGWESVRNIEKTALEFSGKKTSEEKRVRGYRIRKFKMQSKRNKRFTKFYLWSRIK
jgi:hypothetical protein